MTGSVALELNQQRPDLPLKDLRNAMDLLSVFPFLRHRYGFTEANRRPPLAMDARGRRLKHVLLKLVHEFRQTFNTRLRIGEVLPVTEELYNETQFIKLGLHSVSPRIAPGPAFGLLDDFMTELRHSSGNINGRRESVCFG